MMVITMNYVLGLILLILNIWALVNVWSSSVSGGAKLAWTIGIILFPLLGFIVWFFAGPKRGSALA